MRRTTPERCLTTGPSARPKRIKAPHQPTAPPRSAALSPRHGHGPHCGRRGSPHRDEGPDPLLAGQGAAPSPAPSAPSRRRQRAGQPRSPPPADCPHCGFSTQQPRSQTTSLIAVPAPPRRTRGEKGGAAAAAPARRLTGNVVLPLRASARCAARYELHFPESLESATAVSLPPSRAPPWSCRSVGGLERSPRAGESARGGRAPRGCSGRGAMRGGAMQGGTAHPAPCRARCH